MPSNVVSPGRIPIAAEHPQHSEATQSGQGTPGTGLEKESEGSALPPALQGLATTRGNKFFGGINGVDNNEHTKVSTGFILGSPSVRGFGLQRTIPELPLGIVVTDITPLRDRGAHDKLASGGWSVFATLGDQTDINFNQVYLSNRDTEHPDVLTVYLYAIRNLVSLQPIKFPGTNLTLPAQAFVYYKTGSPRKHPEAVKLPADFAGLERRTTITTNETLVQDKAVIDETPGFYRFKVPNHDHSDAKPDSPDNLFQDFSVFVPAEVDASELWKVNVLGHGFENIEQPDILSSDVGAGLAISYMVVPIGLYRSVGVTAAA